jgi:hypothetical protein
MGKKQRRKDPAWERYRGGRIERGRCILYHLGVVLVSLLYCEGGLHLVLGELDHHPAEGGHRLGYLQAGQLPHLTNNKKSMVPVIHHRVSPKIFLPSLKDLDCRI